MTFLCSNSNLRPGLAGLARRALDSATLRPGGQEARWVTRARSREHVFAHLGSAAQRSHNLAAREADVSGSRERFAKPQVTPRTIPRVWGFPRAAGSDALPLAPARRAGLRWRISAGSGPPGRSLGHERPGSLPTRVYRNQCGHPGGAPECPSPPPYLAGSTSGGGLSNEFHTHFALTRGRTHSASRQPGADEAEACDCLVLCIHRTIPDRPAAVPWRSALCPTMVASTEDAY